MELGYSAEMKNGLKLSVDWLSWTFPDSVSLVKALNFIGYYTDEFKECPCGANGYRCQLRSDSGVSVLHFGSKGMGIHFEVSGSGILDVIEHFAKTRTKETIFGSAYQATDFDTPIFCDLLNLIQQKEGHITRLDLAIDDIGATYYSVHDVVEILENEQFTSKFRTWKHMKEQKSQVGCTGETVYLGSRRSNVMLRIYDKQKEQNKKLLKAGEPLIETPWVRWEIELKKESANVASLQLIHSMTLPELTLGVLSNYFRVIDYDKTRKTRCHTSSVWEMFLTAIEKVKVSQPKKILTLHERENYLMRQVAPTLASVIIARKGDMDIVYDMLSFGSRRLSSAQVKMIQEEGVVL